VKVTGVTFSVTDVSVRNFSGTSKVVTISLQASFEILSKNSVERSLLNFKGKSIGLYWLLDRFIMWRSKPSVKVTSVTFVVTDVSVCNFSKLSKVVTIIFQASFEILSKNSVERSLLNFKGKSIGLYWLWDKMMMWIAVVREKKPGMLLILTSQ